MVRRQNHLQAIQLVAMKPPLLLILSSFYFWRRQRSVAQHMAIIKLIIFCFDDDAEGDWKNFFPEFPVSTAVALATVLVYL